jgi:hypothetical protein
MHLSSFMLALHAAVCDRCSRQCDHQGRNGQKEKQFSELVRFHCILFLETGSVIKRKRSRKRHTFCHTLSGTEQRHSSKESCVCGEIAFHLPWDINRHNLRTLMHTGDSQKLNVFCAVSQNEVLGHLFCLVFPEQVGAATRCFNRMGRLFICTTKIAISQSNEVPGAELTLDRLVHLTSLKSLKISIISITF